MARTSTTGIKRKSVWSKAVRNILMGFVDQFREGSTANRRELFNKEILPTIKKFYPDADAEKWKKVKRVSSTPDMSMPYMQY